MRLFWAVLGVLMIAASAYLIMGPGEDRPVASNTIPLSAEPAATPLSPEPPASAPETVASDSQEPPKPAGPAPGPTTPPELATPSSPEATTAASPTPEPPATPPGEPAITKAPDPAPEATKPEADRTDASTPDPAPTESITDAESPPLERAPAPASAPAEPTVHTNEDGSLLINNKFLLKGKGTEAEPYIVTWDHLVSAEQDYNPKEGRSTIPPHIKMLDGKYVQLTGHVAFPLMAELADECLSMLNQWDGCCIGIPPTPYDAVEVKLKEPVTGNAKLTTYGVIKGRLKVEPHLVGGWLVGLYVMDRATLTPETYGGFAP